MSIEGQGHFLTLVQGRVHTKIQTGFSQKLLCRSEPSFYESFQVQGNEKFHYENTPMQHTAILTPVKMTIFGQIFAYFHILAQNIDCRSVRRF